MSDKELICLEAEKMAAAVDPGAGSGLVRPARRRGFRAAERADEPSGGRAESRHARAGSTSRLQWLY